MTTHKEALTLALEAHKKNERHNTVAETRYWCDQYKLLAEQALAQPAVAEQHKQKPVVTDEMVDSAIQAFWGYENKTISRTAYRLAIEAALQTKFCDNNCVWTNHHPDCKLAQSDVTESHKQRSFSEHLEPTKLWCDTCEGTGEVYQEHQAGCHVGGHFKCPDCDGEGYVLSRLYSTTPPQQKPLTDGQFQAIKDSLSRQEGWDGEGWAGESWDLALKKAIEAAHNIKE